MAVRIKDWIIPYTWWDWIDISDNHVISVLLRAANNLIQVNDDREMYVDLQLPAGIEPDDEFPVWVTTWEILAEDWWQQSGTILNSKTTSWDYVRLIYANDGNLYYDSGTWEWIMIWTATAIDTNTKTFFLSSINDTTTAQSAWDWYMAWKNPILMLDNEAYILRSYENGNWEIRPFYFVSTTFADVASASLVKDAQYNVIQFDVDPDISDWNKPWDTVSGVYKITRNLKDWFVNLWDNQTVGGTKTFTTSPVVPSKTSPATNTGTAIATEAQVYLKQDILTAWSWITIDTTTNTISANVQGALVFKGSVATVNDLPSSWNTTWDTYYVTADWTMYSWDGTQWVSVGNTQIDLTNYFNVTTNTSDDITQGSTNLFVTTSEKSTWSGKQDVLTAWSNIQISWTTISATDTKYSAGTWIWINGTTISNTLPFNPENQGAVWQVLKRTSTWVRWANWIAVDGSSLWKYLQACIENGSAHQIAIGADTTYTFQWIWYIIIDRMWWYTLEINGVTIFSYPFSSGTYNEYKYLWPYTMSAWDTVRLWREGSSGTINCRVVDYYPENTPLLNFTANTPNSTIQLTTHGTPTAISLEKSSDGTNWTDYTVGDTITLTLEWEKVYLRNKSVQNTVFSSDWSNYYKFVMTGSIAANWDLNYLVSKYSNRTTHDYQFAWLFQDCTALTSAPSLPNTALSYRCYWSMFKWCSNLVIAPALPATTLATDCYYCMFQDCTSLTSAPTLPATELADECYYGMFEWCTSLTTTPALPATTLTGYCYADMFNGCTSLNTIPALPAQNLPQYCYYHMFASCSSITLSETQTWVYQTPYRIPTTWTVGTKWQNCVNGMFMQTGWTVHTPEPWTTYYTNNAII